jgi:hypothetical protein
MLAVREGHVRRVHRQPGRAAGGHAPRPGRHGGRPLQQDIQKFPLRTGSTPGTFRISSRKAGSTGAVRFTNVGHHGAVAAGGSVEFGFQGTGTGTGVTPTRTTS